MTANTKSKILSFHSIQGETLERKIVFKIPILNDANVFMSLYESSCSEDSYIVIINSEIFLNLWQKEPNGCETFLSNGNPQVWMNDYKYKSAEKGFSFGLKNPVPLADIYFGEHTERKAVYKKQYLFFRKYIGEKRYKFHYIALGNGVTRTIWLLSKRAKYFPVKCESYDSAKKLSSIAGYGENNFSSTFSLLK